MTEITIIIYVTWVLGVFLVIYNIGLIVLRRWRLKTLFKTNDEGTHFYVLIGGNRRWTQFQEYIEGKNSLAGTNWSFKTFIFYTTLLGLVGGIIGIRYLSNQATVIPLAVGFGIIPWAYINYFVAKKQNLMMDQLVLAIQYFVSEYGVVPNVVAALDNIVPRLSYPLSEEVERLVMELNSGKDKEQALFSFASRTNNHWAVRFAHTLNFKLSRGIDINPLLISLLMEMKTKKIKEKERGMESIGIKLESYALYAFVPLMYFLGSKINPQSHYLLTQTTEGKRVMLAIIVLAVGGVLTMIRLNNTKVR